MSTRTITRKIVRRNVTPAEPRSASESVKDFEKQLKKDLRAYAIAAAKAAKLSYESGLLLKKIEFGMSKRNMQEVTKRVEMNGEWFDITAEFKSTTRRTLDVKKVMEELTFEQLKEVATISISAAEKELPAAVVDKYCKANSTKSFGIKIPKNFPA